MPSNPASEHSQPRYPYTIGFNLAELITNMCALVQFHSRKVLDYTRHNEKEERDLAAKARKYCEIAEVLILRCQDALDDADLTNGESASQG